MTRHPPRSPLFPYTTLFRSAVTSQALGQKQRSTHHQSLGTPAVMSSGMSLSKLSFPVPKGLCVLVLCSLSEPSESDRKSTRLNSSHMSISYAVFCLKKKRGVADGPGDTQFLESRPMSVEPAEFVRWVADDEDLAELVNEAKYRNWEGRAEHAILTLETGERPMVKGGRDGIRFDIEGEGDGRAVMVEIEGRRVRVVLIEWHTHPGVTGPSDGDREAI